MNSQQNKWESRRIEHRFHAEIVADITTRNSKRQDMLFDDMNNTNTTQKSRLNTGAPLHVRHPSYYSCYKPGDKSSMR